MLPLHNFYQSLHLALLSELEGIGLQAQKHLHNTMLVTGNYGTVTHQKGGVTFVDALELNSESEILVFGFLPLNAHDLFNSVSDIKSGEVLPELTSFDLRVV